MPSVEIWRHSELLPQYRKGRLRRLGLGSLGRSLVSRPVRGRVLNTRSVSLAVAVNVCLDVVWVVQVGSGAAA
jgi:hypothetical protein